MKKRNSFRNWLPLLIVVGISVLGGLVARSYQTSGHSVLGLVLSLALLVLLGKFLVSLAK